MTPRPDGGSHIDVHIERSFVVGAGVFLQMAVSLMGGSQLFRRSFQRTIDILEKEPVAGPTAA